MFRQFQVGEQIMGVRPVREHVGNMPPSIPVSVFSIHCSDETPQPQTTQPALEPPQKLHSHKSHIEKDDANRAVLTPNFRELQKLSKMER